MCIVLQFVAMKMKERRDRSNLWQGEDDQITSQKTRILDGKLYPFWHVVTQAQGKGQWGEGKI